MKTILTLTLIAAAAFIVYTEEVRIPALTSAADAVVTTPDQATEIRKLTSELKRLQSAHDKLLAQSPGTAARPSAPETHDTTDPEPDARALAQELNARLASLSAQLREKRATLDSKQQTLRLNEQTALQKRNALANRPPTFQELNTRTLPDGTVTTTGGVRTSDADRQKVTAQWQAQIDELDRYLTSIRAAQSDLQQDYRTLEDNYESAVTEVRSTYR